MDSLILEKDNSEHQARQYSSHKHVANIEWWANHKKEEEDGAHIWHSQQGTDAISRHPSGDTNPEILCLPDDIAHTQNAVAVQRMLLAGIHSQEVADQDSNTTDISTYSLESRHSVTWDCVREATASDEDMHLLLSLIENDAPQFLHELPHALHHFHRYIGISTHRME